MAHAHSDQPSDWIVRFAPLITPGGAILDVAAGGGRHSRFFADRGHSVTAIDRDISLVSSTPNVLAIKADLEDGSPLPVTGLRFDGIIVTNYLWRPLIPALRNHLTANGILLYETFAQGNQAFGRPSNPDFLLGRGELLELTLGLTIIAYEDGIVSGSKVAQRICAANGVGPYPVP